MLVHCHGHITVETEGWQAETENFLWLVKGADGKTLQEEEGVILRVIMQPACQMSSLVCRFASNMLQPSSTHLFGLLTPC
jgi:phage terminase large subunit-like protein